MIVTIKKGTHSPVRVPILAFNVKELCYDVTFTNSCAYNIGKEQEDINKLFGIGYLPHHHCNSVRFGWRYHINSNKIELFAYSYINSSRSWDFLTFVNLNDKIRCRMQINRSGHALSIDEYSLPHIVNLKPKKMGYILSPYFGGNTTAPHDIEILISKISNNER